MRQLRKLSELGGCQIQAVDGEIGKITDFIFDEGAWSIRYLVVATSAWLPGRKVLLPPNWAQEVDFTNRIVVTDLELSLIQTAPPYDPDKVISRDYQIELFKHYGKAMDRD